jgi:hypothetical protein
MEAKRQQGCAAPVGKKTEVPDANEPSGKHVKQKAAQELLNRESHGPHSVAVRRVSPAEFDRVAGQSDQALIGDGDAMCVSAEIAEHILWSAERSFAVDDPIVLVQLSQKLRERLWFCEGLQLSVESDLAL